MFKIHENFYNGDNLLFFFILFFMKERLMVVILSINKWKLVKCYINFFSLLNNLVKITEGGGEGGIVSIFLMATLRR